MSGYITSDGSYNNTDLDSIFKARTSAASEDVGYSLNGTDLSQRFEPLNGRGKAEPVGYKPNTSNYPDATDLSDVFLNINYIPPVLEFTQTGGNVTISGSVNNITYDYVIIFNSNGSFGVTNNPNSTFINYILVGGGGTGGGGGYQSGHQGGGGGGGGEVIISSFIPPTNASYTITIGGSTTNSSISSVSAIAGQSGQSFSVYPKGSGGASGSGQAGAGASAGAGGGGGGQNSAGNGRTGGTGTTIIINGQSTLFGQGGDGGKSGGDGAAGTPNTGNGGFGGGSPTSGDSYTDGGSGGSGIVILYFNIT